MLQVLRNVAWPERPQHVVVAASLKEILVAWHALLQDRVNYEKELGRVIQGDFLEISEHHTVSVILEKLFDEHIDVLMVVIPLFQKVDSGQLALGTVFVRVAKPRPFRVERQVTQHHANVVWADNLTFLEVKDSESEDKSIVEAPAG